MSIIVNEKIESYIQQVSYEPNVLLNRMHEQAKREDFPIVGPEVGKFLSLLARMSNARYIFELGSGFGYSAYWFSRGMNSQGRIDMTDFDADHKQQALANLKQAGFQLEYNFFVGSALEKLNQMREPIDIIFNDIDKEDYPKVIAMAYEHLKVGGLFITDNTLWYGKVADAENQDQTTKAVREFNENLQAHTGFEVSILPLRDGVSIAQKIV